MPARRIEFTVSEDVYEKIEKARGFEPRASFVKRALEAALKGPETDMPEGAPPPADRGRFTLPEDPKSSRTPVRKGPPPVSDTWRR